MTWTPERIDELTRLWDEGQSASAIGKQLGISKNAVVGKAHRLKLAARPSPIRKQEAGSATPQRKRSESLAMPARSESSGEMSESTRQADAQAKPQDATVTPTARAQGTTETGATETGTAETGAAAKPEAPATPKPKAKTPPKVAEAHTKAAVKSTAAGPSEQAPEAVSARESKPKPAPRPQPVSRKPKEAESAAAPSRTCQWPIGDPSQPDFHFCERPAAPGRPYCAEHCAMAYITRSKDKSSEAA